MYIAKQQPGLGSLFSSITKRLNPVALLKNPVGALNPVALALTPDQKTAKPAAPPPPPPPSDTDIFLTALRKFFDTFKAAGYNDDQLGAAFRAAAQAGVGTDWYGTTRTFMENWLKSQYPQTPVAPVAPAGVAPILPPTPSSAVLNTAPYPAAPLTSSYSPYQPAYAVPPGIPDTGEQGIPGTGSGGPVAPITYDPNALSPAAPAPSSPLQASIGWIGFAIVGYMIYASMKKSKGGNRASRGH